jgi:xanthine/CO dehydrogenase XdhC/CoxF family maturation factor
MNAALASSSAQGVSTVPLGRVHAPIRLGLGTVTPGEIAVSIGLAAPTIVGRVQDTGSTVMT